MKRDLIDLGRPGGWIGASNWSILILHYVKWKPSIHFVKELHDEEALL